MATWSIWALFFEVEAHGADERQAADEPMHHAGPILEPIGRNIFKGVGPVGYHRYEITSDPVCSTASCSFEDVVEALNRVGVHPHQEVPYVPGDRKQRDVNLPISPFRDLVLTKWIPVDGEPDGAQIGVFNSTVEGRHPLHPGFVQRTVFLDGESYRILTIGWGYGLFGQFNNWFAGHGLWNEGWNEVDQKVRNLLAR